MAWLGYRWLPSHVSVLVLVAAALGCTLVILAVSAGWRIRRPFS